MAQDAGLCWPGYFTKTPCEGEKQRLGGRESLWGLSAIAEGVVRDLSVREPGCETPVFDLILVLLTLHVSPFAGSGLRWEEFIDALAASYRAGFED